MGIQPPMTISISEKTHKLIVMKTTGGLLTILLILLLSYVIYGILRSSLDYAAGVGLAK